ncbi:MAG TPA: MIP family channel protein [Vicinamibacteria bacterium]|nr:MIP family channel protein [Vicinamibacteria bacterium]
MLRGTAREAAAEFLGTFVLIVFGTGVVAQVVLSGQSHGQYLSINIAWGVAVTMGVYVAGGVSGAHLNPAVTLAVAVYRGFPWTKVVPYCAAQMAGAFTGAAVTFLTYRSAFARFDGGMRQVTGAKATAGIFATYPQEFVRTVPDGLIDQVVGTALLIALIFALTDQRNLAPDGRLAPILFGLAVLVIGMSFGFNAGYAINPARDLGPRLFTFVGGWGGEVFRAGGHWWWVPIAGPLIGGLLGGAVYDRLILRNHPAEDRAREAA